MGFRSTSAMLPQQRQQTALYNVGNQFEETLSITLGMQAGPARRPITPPIGELTPIGDMLMPMLVFASIYFMVRTRVIGKIMHKIQIMRQSIICRTMMLIGFMMLLFVAPASAQLKQGDTITVSYTSGGKTYYVARSGNTSNIVSVQGTPTKDCLWVLTTMKGAPSNTGRENNAVVTAQNLSALEEALEEAKANSGKTVNTWFYLPNTNKSAPKLVASNPTSIYTNKSSQAINNYIEANVYMKGGLRNYYLYYNNSWQANTNKQTLRIQKWNTVVERTYRPDFLPTSAIFGYAADQAAATAQAMDVTCRVTKREAKYYYNVADPQVRIVEQEPTTTTVESADATISWLTPSETQMSMSAPSYDSGTKTWSFTLTPQGASPITEATSTNPRPSITDHDNLIRFTKTYADGKATGDMSCTRRAYVHRVLDPLDFTVAHPTYTFPLDGGQETLIPYLYVQKGEELVNSDGIIEHHNITPIYYKDEQNNIQSTYKYRVVRKDQQDDVNEILEVSIADETSLPTWLTFNGFGPLAINFTAKNNTGEEARSATIIIYVHYRRNLLDASGNPTGNWLDGTFRRQVILHQPGSNEGAPIQFHHKDNDNIIPDGQPGAGQQQVHTQKQILYYIPGTSSEYGSEVELHPTELSFYGYRRWYNFDNGHGIQNGMNDYENTIWADAPHITSNNIAYNFTPLNTESQYSHGVFAIAREGTASAGFRTLYYGMTDNVPRIRGYKTFNDDPTHGVHTIACDLSSFIDYTVTETDGKLTSFTEPTLSYRMLFELHPATEMAEALRNLPNGTYLENYEITAPTNTDVHLTTAQRFRTYRYHISEIGYFYYKNGVLTRLQGGVDNQTIVWTKNNSTFTPTYAASTDNALVSSTTTGTVVYTLTVGNYRIAKFTVHYVSPTECGPSSIALLTNKEIADRYQILDTLNWDFLPGVAKPGAHENVKPNYHLPWEDATYGYAHLEIDNNHNVRRNHDNNLCFFGEYLLANQITGNTWIDPNLVNRSGRENGYMMYVDGTMEPGVVATIQTNTAICSGQQVYCSAWIANSNPAGYTGGGANPIFRFNVQGRNGASDEWHDVETFFAGEFPKGSGWRQILFPVNSHRSYEETRVCIYNFATANKGNDFLIDDISLFATPLPISAYQASSACSGEDIVIIVKVDYQNVADENVNKDVYYQGWGETTIDGQKTFVAIPDLADYEGYYLWHNDHSVSDPCSYSLQSRDEVNNPSAQTHVQDMGRLHIPAKNFVPTSDVYLSVQQFIDHLHEQDPEARESRAGLFYIKEADGKYSMYLAHLLQAHEGGRYEIRFAQDSADLASPECAMSVRLDIYKQTKLTTGDGANATGQPILNSCPNIDDEIKVVVTNTLIGEDEKNATVVATGRADWIMGIAADTIYGAGYAVDATTRRYYGRPQNHKSIPATRADSLKFWKDSADVLFEKYYGYTRHEVYSAFAYDLRRVPANNQPNDNYDVSDYTHLDQTAFLDPRNYEIVVNLCKKGLVNLNVGTRSVTLTAGDSLFLWVYPIAGSATFQENMLMVCNAAQWVDYRAPKPTQDKSAQIFNPSPVPYSQMTPAQKLMTPSTRVTASMANTAFTVKVSDIQNAYLAWDSLRVIATDDPDLKEAVEVYTTAYNNWETKKAGAVYPSPTFSMRYYSDKVAQSTNTVKYYQADGTTPNPDYHSDTKDGDDWQPYQPGDVVTFRPIDAAHVSYLLDRRAKSKDVREKTELLDAIYSVYSKTDANWVSKGAGQPGFQHVNTTGAEMHANYTYKMFTNLVTENFSGEDAGAVYGEGCHYATTYFDVIVVPELLIWRPTVNNDWGNDANWHGIVNGKEMDWGFAPLATSSVIIPKLDNDLMYPVVTGDNLYPMSYGYKPASCDNIYMEAGAHILGQEKLSYNNAYVDMPVTNAEWHLMSSPMNIMYSGDFFVPQNGESSCEYAPYSSTDNLVTSVRTTNNNTIFDVAPYSGVRSADSKYAFWTNYYNREVKIYHHNITDDATVYTASADFAPSNALDEPILPGQGVSVLAYGAFSEEPFEFSLRLPKVDDTYHYYLYGEETGYVTGNLARAGGHKFAWKGDVGHPDQMTITLTQGTAGRQFLLGNPTMAYVDLHMFMEDNEDVLSGTFGYMNHGTWVDVSKDILDISGHRFLAPMEAIMVQIEGDEPKSEISVVFKASQLTLDDMHYSEGAPSRAPEAAPHRAQAEAAAPIQLMTITAFEENMEAVAYLGKKEGALNAYRTGEDAYAISSGVEGGETSDDALTTPLNIYTVSDSTSLMVDLRPGIHNVPLCFLTHEAYRTDSVNIIFNMNIDWSTPCYLLDSVAGTREPIMNGYAMRIALPDNHQFRYFIEGPDPYIQDAPQTNPGTATNLQPTQDVPSTGLPVEKVLINGHIYLRRGTTLYLVTGAEVK